MSLSLSTLVPLGAAFAAGAIWCTLRHMFGWRAAQRPNAQFSPVPALGDPARITVWGFQDKPVAPGVPDVSMFVVRVESFLRLIGEPYVKVMSTTGGSENPRGKMPFANLRGTMVDDSDRILRALVQMFPDKSPDAGLSDEQLALAQLVRSSLTHDLYFVQLYEGFQTEAGLARFARSLSGAVPALLVPVIARLASVSQQANLWGQGTGRLPPAEVATRGRNCLRTYATLLQGKQFLLGGNKPTSIDSDLYSFLGPLFFRNPTPAWAAEVVTANPHLLAYTERMRSMLYPS